MIVRTNYERNKFRVSHGNNKWYVDGLDSTRRGVVRGFNVRIIDGLDVETTVFEFADPRRH